MATAEAPALVAGLSMGAVVAMHLAIRRPERVRALVLLANAAWLGWPFPSLALAAVDRAGLPDFSLPKKASDIGDPEMRRTNLTYSAQPVHSAISLLRAGELVRRQLGRIHCPVFIAHGLLDRVCPWKNAQRVAERLGSTDRTVIVLPRSHHIITRDTDRDVLRARLRSFLERFAAEE
jgi:carboxylesterase